MNAINFVLSSAVVLSEGSKIMSFMFVIVPKKSVLGVLFCSEFCLYCVLFEFFKHHLVKDCSLYCPNCPFFQGKVHLKDRCVHAC